MCWTGTSIFRDFMFSSAHGTTYEHITCVPFVVLQSLVFFLLICSSCSFSNLWRLSNILWNVV
jgi:hypothetical protein